MAAPVGFDLDMTLIDSRQAILRSFAGVAADTGAAIDLAAVDRRLGIKLEDELSHWLPRDQVPAGVAIYRRHYAGLAADLTMIMPGAREAMAAVRAAGARAVVITAKYVVPARASLDGVGLVPDGLYTDMHGPEKAAVLASIGAGVYVGDTPADMAAARTAGAAAAGVTTGSFTASDLTIAGADIVFESLAEFPEWYTSLVRTNECGRSPRLHRDFPGISQPARVLLLVPLVKIR